MQPAIGWETSIKMYIPLLRGGGDSLDITRPLLGMGELRLARRGGGLRLRRRLLEPGSLTLPL